MYEETGPAVPASRTEPATSTRVKAKPAKGAGVKPKQRRVPAREPAGPTAPAAIVRFSTPPPRSSLSWLRRRVRSGHRRGTGRPKGSLYHYIDSKEDLLFRLMDETHEEVQAILAEVKALESDDPLYLLQEYFARHAAY